MCVAPATLVDLTVILTCHHTSVHVTTVIKQRRPPLNQSRCFN
jgi:hypothetical protein